MNPYSYIQYLTINGTIKVLPLTETIAITGKSYVIQNINEPFFLLCLFSNNQKISGITFTNVQNLEMISFLNSNIVSIDAISQSFFFPAFQPVYIYVSNVLTLSNSFRSTYPIARKIDQYLEPSTIIDYFQLNQDTIYNSGGEEIGYTEQYLATYSNFPIVPNPFIKFIEPINATFPTDSINFVHREFNITILGARQLNVYLNFSLIYNFNKNIFDVQLGEYFFEGDSCQLITTSAQQFTYHLYDSNADKTILIKVTPNNPEYFFY